MIPRDLLPLLALVVSLVVPAGGVLAARGQDTAGAAAARVDETVRFVVGERPYTVAELIELNEYRANRALFIQGLAVQVQEQQWRVDRQQVLATLAAADAARVAGVATAAGRALQARADQRTRGGTCELAELRELALQLRDATAELEAIEAAYSGVAAVVAGERTRVDAVLRRVDGLRFRVTQDGYVRDGLTLAQAAADDTLSFETLLVTAAQVDLAALDRNAEVRKAVLAFESMAFRSVNGSLRLFDQLGSRRSFDGPAGEAARHEAEECFFLMSYLRAKFRVTQCIPRVDTTEHGNLVIDVTDPLYDLDLVWLLRSYEEVRRSEERWPSIPYLGGLSKKIRLWFLDRLEAQVRAEYALRFGTACDDLTTYASPEATQRALAMVRRQPSTKVLEAFRLVLQTIHAAARRTGSVKRHADAVPAWDDLVSSPTQE